MTPRLFPRYQLTKPASLMTTAVLYVTLFLATGAQHPKHQIVPLLELRASTEVSESVFTVKTSEYHFELSCAPSSKTHRSPSPKQCKISLRTTR